MSETTDRRLAELGITLPALTPPRGSFVPFVECGRMVHLSGKGAPLREPDAPVRKVGAEISVAEARDHAREVAIYLLAVMKQALGGFHGLRRVVKVFGMVNAAPGFTQHTEVIDAASELLVQVLGERGAHARSAIGVGSLPRGFAVEIEAVVERAWPEGDDPSLPPGGLPAYRLLTGPDDAAFCRRVSEALSLGYEMHGSPAITFSGQTPVVAQALVWPRPVTAGERR